MNSVFIEFQDGKEISLNDVVSVEFYYGFLSVFLNGFFDSDESNCLSYDLSNIKQFNVHSYVNAGEN